MRAVLRISGLCILVTLALSGHAYAQNDRAIVLESAPIVLVPDANRTPLAVAAKGSSLILMKDEGAWLQVQFQDPRFGLRTGYILAKDNYRQLLSALRAGTGFTIEEHIEE